MRTTTTTLVICLVFAVAAGICNDDDDDLTERLKNESAVDGSTSLLYNLSTKQRRHVKKELLHLLGLNHIPKPSTRRQRLDGSRASAPTYMLSLYETIRRHDVDDDVVVSVVDRTGGSDDDSVGMSRLVNKQLGSADTVMSFVNQAFSDHENGTHDFAIDCRFDLSGQVSSTDVLNAAFLRIYKSPTVRSHRTEKIRIEIHRPKTNNDSTVDRVPKRQTLEQRVTLLSSRSGWIDVNLTRMTSQWMTSPKRNEGLRIHVFNHRGALVDPSSVGLIGSNGSPDKQVFLVAFFKNNPDDDQTTTTTATRRKRSADNNNNNNNRNTKRTTRQHDSSRPQNDDHQIWYRTNKQERKCQIRTLKVSFKDLKWQDWIIAPEGYAAYYCDGDCVSLLDAHNATNHAIVQTMAYMMNPSSVPKPCCAPTKLSALSVLYFDDNSNVILKKYRNMVVRACGCH